MTGAINVVGVRIRRALGTVRRRRPMRLFQETFVASLIIVLPLPALAHPSRGIAVTPDGTVYFSDLTRIWRIAGDKRILVRDNRGRHSHAMIVDRSGTLVWEESDYDPATAGYRESIWQLGPRGPQRRFGPAANPPLGLGIARDSRGCSYRVDEPRRGGEALLFRLCPGRPAERLAGSAAAAAAFTPALVNDVAGVALAPDGRFVFRHGESVRMVDAAGRMTMVATGLARENFGIAMDRQSRLLVAEFDRRRVVRIAGGRRAIVARSPDGWAPSGVAVGPDGTIFVLEASVHRPGAPLRMQVRAVTPGQAARLVARLTVAQ